MWLSEVLKYLCHDRELSPVIHDPGVEHVMTKGTDLTFTPTVTV
jgi:hypothetical protein